MTSPIEQVTVRCPGCANVYETWFRGSINAELDPDLAADAAYVEEASTGTCPECGLKVELGTLVVRGNVWEVREAGFRERQADLDPLDPEEER